MVIIPSRAGTPASFGLRSRVEFARTPDAWDLALHRYPSRRTDLPPVIMCPGYACNRYFVDFDERYSLARFLARQGFDVWVLELRGRGYSESAIGERRTREWVFDDFVRFDVPTAVTYVRGRLDRRPVLIGHSMGGMAMYAALGQEPPLGEAVAGLVTMASPVGFPPISSKGLRRMGEWLLALPLPRQVPQHGAMIAIWSVMRSRVSIGANPANLDQRAFGQALRRFICNPSRAKLRQFIHWSLSGLFCSCDGGIDYRASLGCIRLPVLLIAGAADRFAPPASVRFVYDHIGSVQKQYREFAARRGAAADYGHVDLIFGRHAPEDVFRTISQWIEPAPCGR